METITSQQPKSTNNFQHYLDGTNDLNSGEI